MNKTTRDLYDAADAYIKAEGGKLFVIGGVQIIQWPDDKKLNFTIGIKCTGRMPEYAVDKELEDDD